MEDIKLTDLIDIDILQKIQDVFSELSGMSSLTTDADGNPITEGSNLTSFCTQYIRQTELGIKRCYECDRNGARCSLESGCTAVYRCHAGLTDYSSPILVEGRIIGIFLGGQVRTEPVDEEKLRTLAEELGLDAEKLILEAKKVKQFDIDDIQGKAKFLGEFANIISDMAYRNYIALDKSRRMEHAARSQTNFIVGLTSDLQSNISDLMDNANRSLEKADTSEVKDAMRDMIGKCNAVYSVVNEAVDYIRLAGEETQLSEAEYFPKDLIIQTVEDNVETARCKNIEIKYDISEDLPDVLLGDAGRIGQVISKLLLDGISRNSDCCITVSAHAVRYMYSTMLIIELHNDAKRILPDKVISLAKYINRKGPLYTAGHSDEWGMSLSMLLLKQMSGSMEVAPAGDHGVNITIKLPQLEVKGRD